MQVDWKIVGGVALTALLAGCGSSNKSQTSSATTSQGLSGSSNTLIGSARTYYSAADLASTPGKYTNGDPQPAVTCIQGAMYCDITGTAPIPAAMILPLESGILNGEGLPNDTANKQTQPYAVASSLQSAPVCDVRIYRYEYATIDGTGSPTMASGALMLPSIPAGASAAAQTQCSGARPTVLYTHGTAISRFYDLALNISVPAQLGGNDQDAAADVAELAANFVSQGYIVVGPNYAGYNTSPLKYHPYLNGDQQPVDAADSLTAAQQVLPTIASANKLTISQNGKLFVTGYSQGGFVAMATLQYLQNHGHPATAGATLSGAYSLENFGDSVINGAVGAGSTLFASMMIESFENLASGSLVGTTIFNPLYPYADKSLPAFETYTQLTTPSGSGAPQAIPTYALFDSAPDASKYPLSAAQNAYKNPQSGGPSPFLASLGLDPTNYLFQDSFREAYLQDEQTNPDGASQMSALTSFSDPTFTNSTNLTNYFQTTNLATAANPQNPLRKILKRFDLRNYVPKMPLLMCGGAGDPTVFFLQNTVLMYGNLGQAMALPTNPLTAPVAMVDLGTPEVGVITSEADAATGSSQPLGTSTGQFPTPLNAAAIPSLSNFSALVSTAQSNYLKDMTSVFESAYSGQYKATLQGDVAQVFNDAFVSTQTGLMNTTFGMSSVQAIVGQMTDNQTGAAGSWTRETATVASAATAAATGMLSVNSLSPSVINAVSAAVMKYSVGGYTSNLYTAAYNAALAAAGAAAVKSGATATSIQTAASTAAGAAIGGDTTDTGAIVNAIVTAAMTTLANNTTYLPAVAAATVAAVTAISGAEAGKATADALNQVQQTTSTVYAADTAAGNASMYGASLENTFLINGPAQALQGSLATSTVNPALTQGGFSSYATAFVATYVGGVELATHNAVPVATATQAAYASMQKVGAGAQVLSLSIGTATASAVDTGVTPAANTSGGEAVAQYSSAAVSQAAVSAGSAAQNPTLLAQIASANPLINGQPLGSAQSVATTEGATLAAADARNGLGAMLKTIHGVVEVPYCMALAQNWFKMYQ